MSTRFKQFLSNLLYILGAIALAAIIQAFIIRPFIVSGTSMDPNIKDKQYLIIDEVSYKFHPPERGDVIVFKAPPEPTKYYIKRVIGLPGDTVKISGTAVTIIDKDHLKGLTLDEPYITHEHQDSMTVTVPPGKYFVMGDNRAASFDSRSWGMLPQENIRGRALLRLLPLSTIDYLPGKETYSNE
ncbi:MAG TPA: signal peptidase I [Candidatus Paceibacterota bacterium]|nr:signal peptidase I [Candidatus Paceibacterota bacterium]